MDQQLRIQAPLEHPSYSGHFPGNPILPGVVLLELIVEQLERGVPRVIRSVKFHRALSPGEYFVLHLASSGSRLTFRCVRASGEGELIAEGNLLFGAGA